VAEANVVSTIITEAEAALEAVTDINHTQKQSKMGLSVGSPIFLYLNEFIFK
jgi:hypothetical protein